VSAPLVPSAELIRRTLDIEVSYTMARMRVLERIEGNPVGIAFRQVGQSGCALMARHFPLRSFNAVIGLRAGDEGALEPLAKWYRDNDVKPVIELVPGYEDANLTQELTRLGYHQTGFHVSMIARPGEVPAPDPAAEVEQVMDAALFEQFLDAYIAGWGISQGEGFRRNVRTWPSLPGWSLFLGRIAGTPAAAAILYVQEGFAYLADAATDPAFRGRGLQNALLAHRLRHAAAEGAEFACSGASFLSTSHRNMVRAGMTLQFVRATWTQV